MDFTGASSSLVNGVGARTCTMENEAIDSNINGLTQGKILTGNHRFSHEIWDRPVISNPLTIGRGAVEIIAGYLQKKNPKDPIQLRSRSDHA